LGDLAVSVVISRHAPSSFDFSTLDASPGAETTLTLKGVVTTRTRRGLSVEPKNAKYTSLILQTSKLGEVGIGDTVTIDGETWNVVPPIVDDGFITEVEVSKEL
jgi:hypothetical protein